MKFFLDCCPFSEKQLPHLGVLNGNFASFFYWKKNEKMKRRNLNNEILAVHDSSRSRFIYGRDEAAFQGRRLRLQSAEREPLPTIVASASPTCYKRSLRR